MPRPSPLTRGLASAALAATAGIVVLGGILRGFGAELGGYEDLEGARKVGGMVLGAVVLGLVGVASWRERGDRRVVLSAWAALAVVGAQGFLGTRAVPPPEDRPPLLAAHLLLTLLLASLLLVVRAGGRAPAADQTDPARRRFRLVALLAVTAAAMQIVVGTQVRGQLDLLALGEPDLPRGRWLAELGPLADAHRHLGGLVGVLTAGLAVLASRLKPRAPDLGRAAAIALVLCIAQVWVGLQMAWRALPPDAQALHLPLGVVLWAALFVVLLRAGRPAPAA